MTVRYEANIHPDDTVSVVKPFNFADRFVGNVGDEWAVVGKSDDFVDLQKDGVRFSLNTSSFVRHFEGSGQTRNMQNQAHDASNARNKGGVKEHELR